MPLVNVMVNGRAYTIACDDGEEGHLKELAGHVDEKAREVLASVGQVGDTRMLLMASSFAVKGRARSLTRTRRPSRSTTSAPITTARSWRMGPLRPSAATRARSSESAKGLAR